MALSQKPASNHPEAGWPLCYREIAACLAESDHCPSWIPGETESEGTPSRATHVLVWSPYVHCSLRVQELCLLSDPSLVSRRPGLWSVALLGQDRFFT